MPPHGSPTWSDRCMASQSAVSPPRSATPEYEQANCCVTTALTCPSSCFSTPDGYCNTTRRSLTWTMCLGVRAVRTSVTGLILVAARPQRRCGQARCRRPLLIGPVGDSAVSEPGGAPADGPVRRSAEWAGEVPRLIVVAQSLRLRRPCRETLAARWLEGATT